MAALDPFLEHARIAYLSMEIALRPEIHTYSGGLGILAGDVARSCADLELPMVLVTLVSRQGYLRQEIDATGRQVDHPDPWVPADWAVPLDAMVAVEVEGRPVWIRAWLHVVDSPVGRDVPVILLDTAVDQNHPDDRGITDALYGGDALNRLKQEATLGIGAARMLRALGFEIGFYHLNEGHAALLAVELLRRTANPAAGERPDDCPSDPPSDEDLCAQCLFDVSHIRARCAFTTHTPAEAGHDRYDYGDVRRVLGDFIDVGQLRLLGGPDRLNMTRLALNLSGYVNGVARRHAETTRRLFPGYRISAVTNGVHPATWVHPALARLLGDAVPG
jgi:starch phosphorylase